VLHVIIFGTGSMAERFYKRLISDTGVNILGVTSSEEPTGELNIEAPWLSLGFCASIEFDEMVVCTSFYYDVVPLILGYGIEFKKIKFCGEVLSQVIAKTPRYYPPFFQGLSNQRPKLALLSRNNSGCNAFHFKRYLDSLEEVIFDYEIVGLEELRNRRSEFDGLVSTNAEGRLFDYGLNVEIWHGFPIKSIGLFEANSKDDYSGLNARVSAFVSYSDLYTYTMSSLFNIDLDKFRVIGVPRNDAFFHGKSKGVEEFLSHNGIGECDEYIVWMPTFRARNGKDVVDGSFPLVNFEDVLRVVEVCRDSGIKIILKLHPVDVDGEFLGELENDWVSVVFDHSLKDFGIDFYDILVGSKCLITDYSSVAYDYLLSMKPIIFYQPDFDSYKESRSFCFSDLSLFFPGPRSFNINDLLKDIRDVLANDIWVDQRRSALKVVHAGVNGGYSSNLYKLIEGAVNERF